MPVLGFASLGFEVLGLVFEVLGLGYGVLGLGYEVLGLGYEVLGQGYEVLGLVYEVLRLGYEVSGLGYEVPSYGSLPTWMCKTFVKYDENLRNKCFTLVFKASLAPLCAQVGMCLVLSSLL